MVEEDDETLAAIDRGARGADEGRLTSIEEVEKMLPKWIYFHCNLNVRIGI